MQEITCLRGRRNLRTYEIIAKRPNRSHAKFAKYAKCRFLGLLCELSALCVRQTSWFCKESYYLGPGKTKWEPNMVHWRGRVTICGNGTLYWPVIRQTQVHLKPGVKLVTSGRYPRATPPFPPKEATATNMLNYAAYIVEPGAKLVFTDNPDYPDSLIER